MQTGLLLKIQTFEFAFEIFLSFRLDRKNPDLYDLADHGPQDQWRNRNDFLGLNGRYGTEITDDITQNDYKLNKNNRYISDFFSNVAPDITSDYF